MMKRLQQMFFDTVAALTAASLLVVFASFGFAQETKAKIRISYPNTSICCLALFAAQQWKIFEQNGLDVESIQMRSQAANSALASGDIHYVAGVGPNSVAATLRGIPSKAVWFASERLIYSVMVRPDLKSLKDLRGKRIGITGLGGTSDVALRIALEAVGENFKDFTIIALGAPQLMSGSGKRRHRSGAVEFTVYLSRQEKRLSRGSRHRRLRADAPGRIDRFGGGDSKSLRRAKARVALAANGKENAAAVKGKRHRFDHADDPRRSRSRRRNVRRQ